jgi:ATP-dependent DNA ligase
MAQFSTLFGTAINGKIKQWSVEVIDGPIIRTSHGYEGGKIQVADKLITQGKNIGKKNETTPLQQAISEAQSLWQKKRDEKFNPKDDDKEERKESRAAVVDHDVPSPMLAHDYNKRGKSIVFPCYIQPKLDGTRMVAMPQRGLFSRNLKAYPHLEHIRQEIDKLSNIVLDGELYSTTLTFQEIVGIVKNETVQPKQTEIKFHVYDMIAKDTFENRYAQLTALFKQNNFKHLILVKTEMCASQEEMKEKHAEYVETNFEGIMLRNKAGIYANNRSVHLQKYKEFFDMECEIVGYKEGEGLDAGCVVWLCKIDGKTSSKTSGCQPKTFACRPRGTREDRQELFRTGEDYVGKMLSVRYQEKTDEGLLRFPVGIAIRDYE